MPTCPSGHDSASTDFCDTCGMRMDGAAPGARAAASAPSSAAAVPAPPEAPGEPCPQCGTARTGQFCEVCGFSFASGTAPQPVRVAAPAPAAKPDVSAPAPPGTAAAPGVASAPGAVAPGTGALGAVAPDAAGWTAVVTADRAYFDS